MIDEVAVQVAIEELAVLARRFPHVVMPPTKSPLTGKAAVSVAADSLDVLGDLTDQPDLVEVAVANADHGLVKLRLPAGDGPIPDASWAHPTWLAATVDAPEVLPAGQVRFARIRLTNLGSLAHVVDRGVEAWLVQPASRSVVGGQLAAGRTLMASPIKIDPGATVELAVGFGTAGIGPHAGKHLPPGEYGLVCHVAITDPGQRKFHSFVTSPQPIAIGANPPRDPLPLA